MNWIRIVIVITRQVFLPNIEVPFSQNFSVSLKLYWIMKWRSMRMLKWGCWKCEYIFFQIYFVVTFCGNILKKLVIFWKGSLIRFPDDKVLSRVVPNSLPSVKRLHIIFHTPIYNSCPYLFCGISVFIKAVFSFQSNNYFLVKSYDYIKMTYSTTVHNVPAFTIHLQNVSLFFHMNVVKLEQNYLIK